ncbi:MAG TPA: hypothetical protein VEJ41_00245 [Candidatus Acidoferrales bacterium]|nr:hypothetical protein [Candidatus Acidoferrales bacterium]
MTAKRTERGATVVEMTIVAVLLLVLVGAFGVPGYKSYAASRASADAASVLASDLAFLVRAAQNSPGDEGATLVIESMAPLHYRGYVGRPKQLDPSAKLETLLFDRTFSGVTLGEGSIDTSTPLLFANNGSAQYESAGAVSAQHATVQFLLSAPAGKPATVELDLFTGAVQTGG